MRITEGQLGEMESGGWVVLSTLWTAEGMRALLRMGDDVASVMVIPGAAFRPYRVGRTFGRLSRKHGHRSPMRRRIAAGCERVLAMYQGEARAAFLRGLSAGMGSASAAANSEGAR